MTIIKQRLTTAPDGRKYTLYSRKSWGKVQWSGFRDGPYVKTIIEARDQALGDPGA